MNHGVSAAGKHDVGVAVPYQLGGLAQSLAAGRASRQTVIVRPLEVKIIRQVSRRRVQFLLGLPASVKTCQSSSGKSHAVNRASLRTIIAGDLIDHVVK